MDPKVLSPDWGYYKTLCLRQTYGQSTLAWGSGCAGRYQARKNCVILWSKHPGFPGGSGAKASACNVEDLGSIPGSGRSLGERNDNPLQYSSLENPTDGGTWWATVHGVAKSRTRLSDFTHSLTHSWSKQAIQWFQDFMCNIAVSTLSKRLQTPF